MTSPVALSPLGIIQFFNNAGQPNVGGSLVCQVGGVPYAVYQDAAGAIPLPFTGINGGVPLNSRGEISNAAGASCQLFLVDNVVYTFTLYDANGNLLNQALSVEALSQTAASIGQLLYPQTAAELAVGVVPTYYYYPPGNVLRYGANSAPGFTDMTIPLQSAFAQATQTALAGVADVYVPPGNYLVDSSSVLSIGANTRFYGSGAGNSIVTFSSTANSNYVYANGVNDVVIERLTFTVQNQMASDAAYVGVIGLIGCSNCRVSECEIIGASMAGIYVQGGSYNQILNNYLHSFLSTTPNWDSSDILFQQTASAACAYNLVQGNQCFGGNANGIAFETSGAGFLNMWKNTIINNHVGAHTGYGILLYSHSGTDTYNEVIGNYIESISGTLLTGTTYPKGAGIYVAGMSAVTIASNRIYSCLNFTNDGSLAPGGIGFNLPSSGSLCTITGNAVFDLGSGNANAISIAGIYVTAGAGSTVPVLISGNSISQQISPGSTDYTGIYVADGVSDSVISGNAVNVINSFTGSRGILVYSNGANTQNFSINGNTVQGCSFRGISLEQNGGYLGQVFSISGNSVSSAGSATCIALNISNASQGSVTGNTLNSTTVAALNVSTAGLTTYTGNNIASTGATAVQTAGTCTGSNFNESNYCQSSAGNGSTAINNGATGFNVRQMVAAIPSGGSGTAILGDVAYNNTGVTNFCWVCTTAGTPGVWTALAI